ncbi:MAG: DinB family protein [Chloroflexi bacterium]|nr:DinB family protein [Chloroflexota bacterium]
MIFQVGIENNNEGRSIAWALEHPGCFAYGMKGAAAVTNLEGALNKYAGWILRHEPNTWLNFTESDIEIVVNGIWDVYFINDDLDKVTEADGYSVESFFPYDWKPLTTIEIKRALDILVWSRNDLLKSVHGLSEAKLNQTYSGERWSINGILGHVGGAEWWYMERLGLAFPQADVPEQPLTRLEKVRKHFNAALFKMDGVNQIVAVDGEFWSPRKTLRRALWHERDHVDHIRKLIALEGKYEEGG